MMTETKAIYLDAHGLSNMVKVVPRKIVVRRGHKLLVYKKTNILLKIHKKDFIIKIIVSPVI